MRKLLTIIINMMMKIQIRGQVAQKVRYFSVKNVKI